MPAKLIVSMKALCEGHQQSVYSVCAGDGSNFFSAGSDGKIVHWNPENLNNGELWAQVPEAIFSMAYSKVDQMVFAGGKSGKLYILKKGSNARVVQIHSQSIFGISVVNSECQYTVGGDGFLRKIDFYQRITQEIKLSDQSLRCIYPVIDGFIVGGSEGKIWKISEDLAVVNEVKAHGNSVFALCVGNGTIFSAGRDAKIKVWDFSLKLIHSIDAHWYTVHGLALNNSGKYLVSGSMDKTIRVWNASKFNLLKVIEAPKFDAHKSSVNGLLWIDEKTFVSCSDDTFLKCWEIDDTQL